MPTSPLQSFISVYGPVHSWRYGQSLGIDPIGPISTCSYDCVYCQLGAIQEKTIERRVFVPTAHILQDLQEFAPWDVDVITISGSGEPTLALNLGEMITAIKKQTGRPVGVLTNGSLLTQAAVRSDLQQADHVSIKIDAVTPERWQRVDRPVASLDLTSFREGLQQFCQTYKGQFAIQTMLLQPWNESEQEQYIEWVRSLAPHEVQLNTPTRPKPQNHQLDGRGNYSDETRPYAAHLIKQVSQDVLNAFALRIQQATGVPVRYPGSDSRSQSR